MNAPDSVCIILYGFSDLHFDTNDQVILRLTGDALRLLD